MRLAAAVTLFTAVALTGCGEKDDRIVGVSGAEARALVGAGARAVAADVAALRPVTVTADGPVLRIRVAAPAAAPRSLLGTLRHFSAVEAHIVPFCPKPAILGCKPALQATGQLRRKRSFERLVDALRSLAERTYEQRPVVRRPRPGQIRIATANGELLAAAVADGRTVRLSFGGPSAPPRRAPAAHADRLVLDAAADALAAMRRSLGPQARAAIAGVRRLEIVARP